MTSRGGVDQTNRDTARVPVPHRSRVRELARLREGFKQPRQVGLEPVSHHDWGAAGCFDQLAQGFDLRTVDQLGCALLGVEASGGQLHEFVRQPGCVLRIYKAVG